MKIGLIKEGKVPSDKRVAMTPKQCVNLQAIYPNVKIVVQESNVRKIPDTEYEKAGIDVVKDLHDCDLIIGIKEVNVEDLIPNKKFMFFSHTFKKQPYNRKLLKAILDKKIQLIDYEVMKDKSNKRIIGFGRYAGIVGCYNAFRTFGLKHKSFDLKPACECDHRKEVEEELKKVVLPQDLKIVLTGFGRVGHGAREIIDLLPIKEVSPTEFLSNAFNEPVYTQLEAEDYYAPKNGQAFDKAEFYSEPEKYKSVFGPFANVANMYIPCHFWNNKSPYILTAEDLKNPACTLSVVADISCDPAGPIACTIRSSEIANPIYGYDPISGEEVDFMNENAIAVMAIDNLPCELPLDASEDFGNELIKHIFPALLKEDPHNIIGRASQTNLNGELTEHFSYLQDYVNGEELALK